MMCTVCGCGTASIAGPHGEHEHAHDHDHNHDHDHDHSHGHHHAHGHDHHHEDGHVHGHPPSHAHEHETFDFGAGLAGVHVAGLSQDRIVRIERDILSKNNFHAQENRARLATRRTFALNFLSSPG